MADVMGAFFRGKQFAHAEAQHSQQQEENALRLKVLKHQIDGIKIEDAVRQRALAKQQLELMDGMPAASMPSVSNLPSTSTAGAMTGLPGMVSGRIAEGMGAAPMGESPTTMPAPSAQATAPERRPMTVPFGAIPEMGLPAMDVAPRTLEEITRAKIAEKLAEPRVLNQNDMLVADGKVVQRGNAPHPTAASLAAAAAGGDTQADAALGKLRSSTARPPSAQEKDVLLDGELTKVLFDPAAKKYLDLDGGPIENAAKRIRPYVRTSAARTNADPDAPARRDYDRFVNSYERAFPPPRNSEVADLARMMSGAGPEGPAPTYKPAPSFDKWKVMTPQERQKALSNQDARIDDAEMMRRMERGGASTSTASPKPAAASVPPNVATALQGQAKNKRYRLTDGSVWDVLADGTIVPGPK